MLVDLYRFKADVESVWEHLAEAFAPGIALRKSARDRAQAACSGRQALIVIEGAEEAGSGSELQTLMEVLAPTNQRLVLTRNRQQDWTGHPLALTALDPADGQKLLARLAPGVPESILATIVEELGAHPLALTWVGYQLGASEEKSAAGRVPVRVEI